MKITVHLLLLVSATIILGCGDSSNPIKYLETPTITNLTTDTTTAYLGVYFENANKGYVVGTKGTIVTTGNGGTDWEKIKLATNETLLNYYVYNSKHYVCGVHYIGTGDDVNSITEKQISDKVFVESLHTFLPINGSVLCCGGGQGINACSSTFITAENSGDLWNNIIPEKSIINALGSCIVGKSIAIEPNIVLFPIRSKCFFGKNYGIFRLNTQTWTLDTAWLWKDSNNTKGGSIRALSKGGDGTIVGIGVYDGLILVSKDNGNTWNQYAVSAGIPLLDVAMVTSNLGFACGEKGVLLRTEDGGITWSALSSGVTEDLHALYFPTSTVGYAVGNKGTILKIDLAAK